MADTVRSIIYDPETNKTNRAKRGHDPRIPRVEAGLYQHLSQAVGHLPQVTQVGRRLGKNKKWGNQPIPSVHENLSEMRLIESGDGVIEVNGREWQLGPGSLIVLGPGDVHRTVKFSAAMFNLHFYLPPLPRRRVAGDDDSFLRFLLESYPSGEVVQVDPNGPMFGSMQRVLEARDHGGVGSDLLASLALVELLVQLARTVLVEQDVRQMPAAMRDRRDRLLVYELQTAIRSRLGEKMTIGELLAPYPLAANYLRDIFKRVTGQSIQDWWQAQRMAQARELLKDPSWTIAAVAETVGFKDYHYFLKVFKQAVGVSPGAWRQKEIKK